MSILNMVTLWIEIIAFVILLALLLVCPCPCLHFLLASNKVILCFLYDKTRHRRSFCPESHILVIPRFLSLLLHCLMMHRLTLWPLPFLPLFSLRLGGGAECPSAPACSLRCLPASENTRLMREIYLFW